MIKDNRKGIVYEVEGFILYRKRGNFFFYKRKGGYFKVRGFLIGMLGRGEIRKLLFDVNGEFYVESFVVGRKL